MRAVVDALVAGEAPPVARVEHDRAVLARVVAPHAANEHLAARAVRQRQGEALADARAVERDDRFAHVDRDLARRRLQRSPGRRMVTRAIAGAKRDVDTGL